MEVVAAAGAAWEPGNGHPCPDDEAAAEEDGRWRVVLNGDDQESMRKLRGEAKFAVDELRLVMLRAERAEAKSVRITNKQQREKEPTTQS